MRRLAFVLLIVALVLSAKVWIRSLSAPNYVPGPATANRPIDGGSQGNSKKASLGANGDNALALLRRVSQFGLRIQSGGDTLYGLKMTSNEPDATMWELRVLAHSDDEVIPLIKAYVLSVDEPLLAKLLVVLSLAQPQRRSLVMLLSELIRTKGVEQISIAASLTFGASGANGIGSAWTSLMAKLSLLLGCDAYYRGECEPFVPRDHDKYPGVFRSNVASMDVSIAGAAMVDLMQNSHFQVFRGEILDLTWQIAQRSESSDSQRSDVRELAIASYLRRDDAWSEGLEILTHSRLGCSAADIEVLERGLSLSEVRVQCLVLDRLAAVSPRVLFEGSIGGYLPGALDYLAKDESQGGPPDKSMGQLMWSLIADSHSPDSIMQSIVKHESLVLRRRCADTLNTFTRAGNVSIEKAARVLSCGRTLLSDVDVQVRARAACALVSLLNKRRPVLDVGVSAVLKQDLRQWFYTQDQLKLNPEESALIKSVADQFK